MKFLIKVMSIAMPISVVGSNPIINEMVEINTRIVKDDLSNFDNNSYSIHGIEYHKGWEEDIFLQISDSFSQKNQHNEEQLFINLHNYGKEWFIIRGNNFSVPKVGKYNRYKINIQANEKNPFYKGATTFELKIWNDGEKLDIFEEYDDFINNQYFKENFSLSNSPEKEINNIFIEELVKFINRSSFVGNGYDAELLKDAWENGELIIKNSLVTDNDFYSIYEFELYSIESKWSKLLVSGKKLEFENVKLVKRQKTSFSHLQDVLNDKKMENFEINNDNYNDDYIIDKNIDIIDDYFNKNPNNTIYKDVGNFLSTYRSQYDISVSEEKEIKDKNYTSTKNYYFVKRTYEFIPNKNNNIFINNSVLSIDFVYKIDYKDEVYNFNSLEQKHTMTAKSSKIVKYKMTSKVMNIDFKNIKEVDNFEQLIYRYSEVKFDFKSSYKVQNKKITECNFIYDGFKNTSTKGHKAKCKEAKQNESLKLTDLKDSTEKKPYNLNLLHKNEAWYIADWNTNSSTKAKIWYEGTKIFYIIESNIYLYKSGSEMQTDFDFKLKSLTLKK
ncbi:hypothetical protein [Spiroplasma endosymbiont of Diplazon laetatorius]|uniref:hypothetical protein n=1 Tax=Spiroplasma endosymbiont of Diplazon laetatorius TaxID=3066322 RepID=UPI0030CEAE78